MTSSTRSRESASRSSLKRVSSWIRAESILSSAAKCARMRSSTSSLFIGTGEATSGRGPQCARSLEGGGGSVDHSLVHGALCDLKGAGDRLGRGAPMPHDHDTAEAQE